MKPLRRLTNLLAACAVTAAAFGQPALAADLRNDPVVQDLLRRENFDPGKKFHLFGKARGTVAERTGLMTISPTITQRLGNLQMETATIFSNPGYIVRFSGHGHEVHSPFDNSASKSDSWTGGKVTDGTGMTFASMSWDGYEHHPADGYDGPQGGGYPAPHGARDIYSYVAKGQVRRQTVVHDDNRSTQQRFADRFGNIPKNFSDRAGEANKKMFEHNPGLNRWGNSMEFINGVAAGALNPFLSVGEAIGVGDAVQGTGFAIDMATAGAISTMSPDNAIAAIDHLKSLAKAEEKIGKTVRDWTAENPNAAETVEAVFNVAAAAKVAKLAKAAKPGKAAVSGDFADSYKKKLALSDSARQLYQNAKYREALDIHYEDLIRRKTGGSSKFINGREIDAVTNDALIQAKRTISAIDKPKNFLNQKNRKQIKATIEAANQQGKRAEFWFKYGVHSQVKSYIESKGGIVKTGLGD